MNRTVFSIDGETGPAAQRVALPGTLDPIFEQKTRLGIIRR
jgi:hypothetical protein